MSDVSGRTDGNTRLVNVTVDGRTVSVPEDFTVIQAARKAGIIIPQLCYHPALEPDGACRVCLVDIEGARGLSAACCYPVSDGMVVRTNTKEVRSVRGLSWSSCSLTTLWSVSPARETSTASSSASPPTLEYAIFHTQARSAASRLTRAILS